MAATPLVIVQVVVQGELPHSGTATLAQKGARAIKRLCQVMEALDTGQKKPLREQVALNQKKEAPNHFRIHVPHLEFQVQRKQRMRMRATTSIHEDLPHLVSISLLHL
jgi:hypothetical protein